MAMKVSKTVVHRLTVDMACSCRIYAEFADVQCKEPLNSDEDGGYRKVFTSCEKHSKDVALAMLEFFIGERLDEAVEAAKTTPVQPTHRYAAPGIEEGDTGGVVATGETVQSVAKVNIRNRPQDPTAIKTLQVDRPTGKRAKGSSKGLEVEPMMAEIQIEEVDEDENITSNIIDLFDDHDPTEYPDTGARD